ncbi:MAG: hypothetical protein A2V93_01715 [Ignavibacteria bacterium RBG_16_34_14]|nr:MAG: hypothetical protein A2V93_01715 [Ignavibacteria bacterium RBG_16_34_14]
MNNFSGIRGRETRISKILEDIPLGIISFNADGIIDFVNPAFSKMGILYRLKIASLIGTNIFEKEIIPGVSLPEEMKELKKGFPFEKEIKNLKIADGSEISVIIKCSPFYEDDQFDGGILVLEDLKAISEAREDDLLKIESFKKVTNEITDFFFIVDSEGIIKYSAGSKMNLISYADSKNVNIRELIPNLPDDFKDILANVRAKGNEKRIILKLEMSNEPSYYECLINPLSIRQQSKFLSCVFINISGKIKSENLEERLSLFETVADVTSDGIIGVNAEGIINLWSPSVLSLTGFSDEETIGMVLWEYVPTLNQKSFNLFKKDLQQIHFFKKQILILNNLGIEIPVYASFLLGDEDNILISLSSASKEIQLQDFKFFEENFRNFVTKADIIVLRLNDIGIIEYLNPAFISQLNFQEEEAIGKNLNEFLIAESKLAFESYQDRSYTQEIVLLNKRGEKIYYRANIIPLYSNNILDGFNIYLIDLSDKKKEEKDLQLFKFLFANTKEGIAVENKGIIIAANNAFGKLFGYSLGNEIIGKDILDLAATNDVLKIAEYLQLYQTKKELSQRFEFSGKRKDGSTFSCELTPSSFEIDGSWYLVLIIRDITERKQAQQVIRESEEKYRNLIENIDDFLYTFERSRLFFKPVFFTSSVNKITGFSQTEMLNDSKLLFKIIHPDDLVNVKENLKNFSKSRNKISIELEFRIINKQGNVVWVRNKLSVVRNEKAEVQKVYGLVSDISLRKKAEEELKKSTQNLVKLNETKDRFISIISHDLRTPFSSILGFTDLILHDDSLSNKERNQYVSYIQESSNAMLSLVNSLLDWTRLQTGRIRFEPERVEVSEIILKSINALAGAAFQKNISINSAIQKNLYVYVDKDLIVQVFNNLISNAIKFTKEGGSITISATPLQHTRFYEFSVKDTGVGIKPEDAKKLFGVDTKFTTEGTAGEKGTGLGLSLVKEIIEKHGGTIRVESEPGSGSNFLFTLPVASANILLVDSNTTDRILYSKILKHITSDYNIDTVANGREALNKISASTYALIITEHNMPVMGGYDLALELKKLDMKVKPPVIILSNSVERETIDDYNEIGVEQVFQKPVNLSLFKRAVEKALHQGLK